MNLSEKALDIIHKHASEAFPNECVGFLYGKETGDDRSITVANPIHNSKDGDQRRRFEVSPLDYMKAEQFGDDNDLTLLGVYHSHPLHPAIPSAHDLKQAVPFFSYIITSVNEERTNIDTTSWRLADDGSQFEKEILKTEKLLEISE
ncbi:MAG: M67 family metallopeptidase [Cyclobacteriaceae bacterium]